MASIPAYETANTSDTESHESDHATSSEEIRLTHYRWCILALYSLTAFMNTLVWLCLFTVNDITSAFYNIESAELMWSTIVITVLQIIVAVPATFLPSRFGLRPTMILVSIVNTIGSCIIIASARRHGFPYFIAGQVVIALASAVIPQLAPQVSAAWFGEKEHAFSTGVGLILARAGAAIGFLQPALMFKDIEPEKHIDYVQTTLEKLAYSQAAICGLLLILVILFFKNKPMHPPTLSEALRNGGKGMEVEHFTAAYKEIIRNRHYLMGGNAFALNEALVITIPVLLNAIISWKFPRHDVEIGWMGFSGIISAIVGCLVFSIILDRTLAYKMLLLPLCVSSLIIWIAFTEVLARWSSLPFIFVLFNIGLFVFVPIGPIVADMIAEMTYPVTGSISLALPVTFSRIYAIPLTFLGGFLMKRRQHYILLYIVAGIVALQAVFALVPKIQKRRAAAGKRPLEGELDESEESLLRATESGGESGEDAAK